MKQFLKDYGFAILSAIVIITLVTMSSPIGIAIKTEVSNITNSFAALTENKFDHIDYDPDANPYTEKVLSVQALYDVGEQNLTQDDIVNVNGVDCYVLELSSDKSKAKLITKEIYDVKFDTGGHTPEETQGRLGTFISYTDKTYDYKYSTLRQWMNEFYLNILRQDPKIVASSINYYVGNNTVLSDYVKGELSSEYVFPLDAVEAENKQDSFKWTTSKSYDSRFWISAAYIETSGHPVALTVANTGIISNYVVWGNQNAGARPVFWLSLE